MTERQPDDLGVATDRLITHLREALIRDEPIARDAALSSFHEALGDWMAVLIGRCSSQSSGFIPLLNDKIDRLGARIAAAEEQSSGGET
jgi:hypothetical protein